MKNSTTITALLASSLFVLYCSNHEKSASQSDEKRKAPSAAPASPAESAKTAHASDRSGLASGAASARLPAGPTRFPLTEAIFTARSAECQTCLRNLPPNSGCDVASIGCETLPEGKEREQCFDTLRCVLPSAGQSSCVDKTNSNLTACYCGTATVENCLAGKASGVCKKSLEVGLRSTDPGTIARTITDRSLPSGVAMKLVQCVADVGRLVDSTCRSCF
ncbi:MAG: hypothetical protein ABW133_10655 [Polyangiaceae bacterium]